MLSQKECNYLSGKIGISQTYKRVLNYRIKRKLKQFFIDELPILREAGITEINNIITEYNNAEVYNPSKIRCGRRDLNPGNGLGRPVY